MLSWHKDQPPPASGADHPQSAEHVAQGFWLLHIVASTYRRMLAISLSPSQSAAYKKPNTAIAHPSRSSRESGGMGRRVRLPRERITYLPIGSESLREDELLARAWGCKPSSAHQRKLRVAHEAADVIRTKREAGATESLAGWLRPIEEALAHQSPDGNHELTASLADCAEDSAEANYRADPTEANARLLLRKRAMERQTSIDHDRDLAVRWGINP